MLPALTISVKKWRCCLPCCWTCLTKGDSCPGMQRTSPAAITEQARLWGPFLTRNPHCTPPRGVLLIPAYKSHWRQDCSPALLCFHQKEEKKSRFMGPEGGAKNVCVCACVSVYYIQTGTHTQTHTYVYTHIHTAWLQHLVVGTTLGRGRSIPWPSSSWITTEGLLVLWGSFFTKQITGGKKKPWMVQAFGELGLFRDEQLKG